MGRRRLRRGTVGAALVLGAAVVVLGIVVTLLVVRQSDDRRSADQQADAYPGPAVTTRSHRIVSIVSDELVDAPESVPAAETWPVLVGGALNAQVFVVPVGGSYTRSVSPDGATLVNAVNLVAPRADAVVVLGGLNDVGKPRKSIVMAAARVYAAATSTAPNARLVVIGPVARPDEVTPKVLAVRNALRTAVSRTHADFVDPIADGWFTQDAEDFDSHGALTVAGERRMAAYVERALSGVLP